MKPRSLRVAGILCLGRGLAFMVTGSGRATVAQAPPPTFPSQVEVVTVDVIVLDKEGHPVAGLTRDDLVVEEDGEVREIVTFERFGGEIGTPPVALPVPPLIASNAGPPPHEGGTFALVVDDLGLGHKESADTREALTRFVTSSLRDGDLITLATTSGAAWWTTAIPQGREDLLAIIGRLQGRMAGLANLPDRVSDYEAFAIRDQDDAGTLDRVIRRWTASGVCPRVNGRPDPGCPGRVRARAANVDGIRRIRARVILATVRRTLDAFALSPGRKSILLYSPGFLRDSDPSARELAAAAREANAAVYFIDTRGLSALASGTSAGTRVHSPIRRAQAHGPSKRVCSSRVGPRPWRTKRAGSPSATATTWGTRPRGSPTSRACTTWSASIPSPAGSRAIGGS